MSPYPLHDWLPLAFAGLMGLSILIYVVLDGFDLGVGLLSIGAPEAERDVMVASIGPFWDANETWLVLAVGLLLVAFPIAHGVILTALYVPATLMLIGLVLRGVAFEFRAKAPLRDKALWDLAFFAGSLIAALTQGYMLGVYILGLDQSPAGILFGLLTGICLAAAYAFIGATWLIAKAEGTLHLRARAWARKLVWAAALGMIAVSAASPLASARIFEKWFALPQVLILAPVPLVTAVLFVQLLRQLSAPDWTRPEHDWGPFQIAASVFVLGAAGMGYSFFPYVVPDRLTVWDAASARGSLAIILVGALVTLPMIIGYSIFAYRVFRGKATGLTYD